MKGILKISLLVAVLFSAVGITQAQKFGYVNSATILADMPEVKQAEANLEALQKQLQKKGQSEIEKFQQDYVALQQKAEQGELSPKQQEEEAKKLQEREAQLSQLEQQMVQQMQEKRNELLEPIYAKVNEAIKSIAEENGYTMIFDQSVLLYKEDGQDVSNLVKEKLGIVN